MKIRQLLLAVLLLSWVSGAVADVAASVVFFTGKPTLTAANGEMRPLLRGAEVSSGDTVNTHDGRVQLKFRDGASMSLQPETQFRVDKFRYSGQSDQAVAGDGIVMSLLKGALRTVSGWLGKRDRSQYRIGTTVATIGIRGTDFGASMDGSGLTVTTYAGLVEVCSQAGCVDVAPAESVWVRAANEKPRLRSNGAQPSLDSSGLVPDIPVNREITPAQPVPEPVQPVAPTPYGNQYPNYNSISPTGRP